MLIASLSYNFDDLLVAALKDPPSSTGRFRSKLRVDFYQKTFTKSKATTNEILEETLH